MFFNKRKLKKFIDENGNLVLSRQRYLTNLPDNLIVEGNLFISGTAIKQLPKGLIIKGDLWARDTELQCLPEDIQLEGKICCSEDSPLVNLAFEGYKIVIVHST